MAEVNLSRLAMQKSTNPTIKQFAEMMLKDHSEADAKLKAIAKADKIAVPTAPTPEQQAVAKELGEKSGPALDSAYAAQMVKDHEKAVALFSAASDDADMTQGLRIFAARTLPTLEHHLDEAKKLNDALAQHTLRRHDVVEDDMTIRRSATPCAEIPVLLIGRTARTAALHELLARSAHPIRQVPTWRAAEQAVIGMRVAVLFALPPGSLIECVDRLRVRAEDLRVILALPEIDITVEEQTMLREYVHLAVLGPELDAVRASCATTPCTPRQAQPTALHDRGFLH